MIGLIFVDRLVLTLPQMCACIGSMWVLLAFSGWQSVLCSQLCMLTAFWNQALSIDTRLLFASAQYLTRYGWPEFLSEFALRDYVKLQPPFYTFWVSRLSSLPYHQIVQAGLAVGCGLLLFQVYGDAARYLCSTPIFLLMSTQPSNDFVLFFGLLVSLRLIQMYRRTAAAFGFGLLWLIKPLMVLTIPFMLLKLRSRIILSLAIIGSYLYWSQQYYFGVKQWQFLLFQISCGRFGAH